MEEVIEYKDKTIALLIKHSDYNESGKTKWISKQHEPLQGSLMVYDEGKIFDCHKHKLNPRIINHTQEAFVVIKGIIRVDFYIGNQDNLIGSLTAYKGDAIFIWHEFHELRILKDNSKFYELKAGQFNGSVSDDKEYLND